MIPFLLLLAAGIAQSSAAVPLQGARPATTFVRVHGESTVSAPPDQARIDIGVITQGSTAQAATSANAKQADGVMKTLKSVAPNATLQTINFSVSPNLKYPKEGGQPTIQGYTANNTVHLELNDLTLLSKVIDTSAGVGANNMNSLTWALKDDKAVRAKALGEAARDARASAEALAVSMGQHVGRILQMEEGDAVVPGPVRPMMMAARAEAMAAETPVSPGTIEVRATVTVTFELLP